MLFRGAELTVRRVIGYPGRRLRKLVFSTLFQSWERMGFHLTENHFYGPVPDTRTLRDELWRNHSRLVGLSMNDDRQQLLLAELSRDFRSEYDSLPQTRDEAGGPEQYFVGNGGFGPVDGEMLYCMIRRFKPKRVFEIGSGNSSMLSAQALRRNEADGHPGALTAFDPYPNEVMVKGFPGLARLVSKKIQDVPLSEFEQLEANDILFIDSSHVLNIGSDVQYEYLEVLPRLAKGVIVHAHDIFLPAEYPKRSVMEHHCFWTEQYLLQAFLAFNHSFEVLWAASYMHFTQPALLEAAIRSYRRDRDWPGSFWMRRTAS
jgi:hypothetical protein